MRVRPHFESLIKATPEERHRLLRNDIDHPARELLPDEDLPFLIEILNGSDPDLAASAASHLLSMARQNRGAGAAVREQIAAALPAIAAHYDDADPPVMNSKGELPSGHPTGSKLWPYEVIEFICASGATPPPPLVPKLVAALRDDAFADTAATALLRLKPLPKEILEAMVARIRQSAIGDLMIGEIRSQTVKEELINIMSQNGVSEPEFVLALAAILDNPDERHGMAAVALSRIGSAAKLAESALRRIASRAADPQPFSDQAVARSYALVALKNITPN